MHSDIREDVVEAFDALAVDLDRALDLDFDALTTPERLALLQRCERLRRRLPAVEHPLVNGLVEHASPAELGKSLAAALADRLHITRGEARRRIEDAAQLGPRRTLTGQPLEPVLPTTAAAQRDGTLGAAHIKVIRDFFAHLPDHVDIETQAIAEEQLAGLGAGCRPDELTKLATELYNYFNPDGRFSDVDRARRRSLVLGRQGPDGMSSIKGLLTPEARATVDAVLARLAAPGMCNPDDEAPCTSGTPSQEAIDNDHRSAGQRNHDALVALARAMLASGDLGQHNGLPASIIISTSLSELEAATGTGGKAHTGGGTWLPIRDVIRMASHAHQWLRVFHDAKEVALFHTRRIASPGQRIVLYAKDRGCTHPGCPIPGYLCEVHHVTGYAQTRDTDIHDLTLACGPHHRLVEPGGWTTRMNKNGQTQWIPPPHLDRGRPGVNYYHHPERILLRRNENDAGEDDEAA
ncbi:MAG TPA: HNH endonuclease signature motif containing protein [Mycobacterium sp.]